MEGLLPAQKLICVVLEEKERGEKKKKGEKENFVACDVPIPMKKRATK